MAANTLATATAIAPYAATHDEVDFIVAAANNNNISNNNNNNNNKINSYDSDNKLIMANELICNKMENVQNRMQIVAPANNNNLAATTTTTTSTATTCTTTTTAATAAAQPNTTTANPTATLSDKSNNAFDAQQAALKIAAASEQQQQNKKPAKERLSIFSFSRKLSQKNEKEQQSTLKTTKSSPLLLLPPKPLVPIGTPPRQHKFVKSTSIARLLGNTYNAKKFEKQEKKRLAAVDGKFNTYSGGGVGGRRRNGPYLERFKRVSKEDGDVAGNNEPITVTGVITLTTDSRDLYGGSRSELVGTDSGSKVLHEDLGMKAMRSLTRGLGKLWWKRSHSVDISTPDPEFKVSYLGNVLTGWAKGEGCVEKQLNTLWRNYTQNNKPDVLMRVKVCASGLKATTRQHGLTEYWANRITYCCAPKNYPRVFCWIYRHEGRKLKHELRCHAVLCGKEKIAQDLSETLRENIESALREFKREKILKQNARLSLANAVYDNPSLPRRKIMLSVGGNNYRPPLERSKSAPKLMAIEEAIGEEDGDEIEETNEPEMRSCCQKDSLYPAMTLGRRRCRRGHSIRRTGKVALQYGSCCAKKIEHKISAESEPQLDNVKLPGSAGSDLDDFEKLLKYNDYDSSASLSTELLPYFDMQLHKNTSQSLGSLTELKDMDAVAVDDDEQPLSLLPTINSDPSADPCAEFETNTNANAASDDGTLNDVVALRRSGVCSDGEEDYLDSPDDMYFRQAAILNMLHRNSMRKITNLSLSSDESSSIETNASAQLPYRHQQQSSISSTSSSASTSASATALTSDNGSAAAQRKQQLTPDSDEGSISSGCETASTVTANQDDISLKYRQLQQQLSIGGLDDMQRLNEYGILDEEEAHAGNNMDPAEVEALYQRLASRQNSDAATYSSSSSITLKMSGSSPTASVVSGLDGSGGTGGATLATPAMRTKRTRKHAAAQREQLAAGDSDSECSDESGYVEFQEKDNSKSVSGGGAGTVASTPPKPMPRRLLNAAGTAV